MPIRKRCVTKPEQDALKRAVLADGRTQRHSDRADRLARELEDMRDDRNRWREQAERLAATLGRLKAPSDAKDTKRPIKADRRAPELPATPNDIDVLYGVPNIAKVFGLGVRQVYHLKDVHGLPTFKIGKRICAKKSAVASWFADHNDAQSINYVEEN